MRFSNVVIESMAVVLPEEIWTSAEIENRLKPLYDRLRLPEGRLELMTGIRERRHWSPGTRASDASARAGAAVLARTRISPDKLGVMAHTSVSRDMLEPATAAFVHRKLGLPDGVQILDISNARLGFLNGMTLVAGMIESGQIEAGLLVSGENGRPLIEETLRRLVTAPLTRNEIKPYFANLTIGSGAVAAVLCHRSLAGEYGHRLVGGSVRAATEHSDLCQGDHHGADSLAMQTDSEQLLIAGVELARKTWDDFLGETGWTRESIRHFVCHQVGSVHRRKLYEALELDLAKDYSTFETLGNMGSASLPASLALAADEGRMKKGERVGLLGIGSGLNCLMLGVEW